MLFEENGLNASKARYAQRQSFDKQCPYNGAKCACWGNLSLKHDDQKLNDSIPLGSGAIQKQCQHVYIQII